MPLMRYPGAKGRLLAKLRVHWPALDTLTSYVEPFIGAGSVFESLSPDMPEGTDVLLVDADADVAALWREVQRDPSDLLTKIDAFVPTVEAFYTMRDADGDDANDVDRAFRKLVLHQTSFSGLGAMAGGPIGGAGQKSRWNVGCRWSPKTTRKHLENMHVALARHRVKIVHGDFSAMTPHLADPESFIYLDPPYYAKGKQCYVQSMTHADHERLAGMLKSARCRWLLSYDNATEIQDLYRQYTIVDLGAKYSITGKGRTGDVIARGLQADVVILSHGAHQLPVIARVQL